ncbi:fused DSP-PTPase phosphatase/NAD kinase-like protein [Candidatus Avelusimicrobium sp.]|uniref:fused DSP-PTPase phosphatase/NAD kinase-like protein n=1 Tax=Candidatus Avelusimicrobium sp. TaxID=3048833 RepID=UPI003D7D16DB
MRFWYLLLIFIFSLCGATDAQAQRRALFPKKPIRVQVYVPKVKTHTIHPLNVQVPKVQLPAVLAPQYRADLEHQLVTQALQAQPLRAAKILSNPGLPNAYQVSPWLYRGGQPTRQGYEELVKMGIKTVINLRVTPQDKKLIAGLPLTVYQVPINPVMLNTDGVDEVLKLLSDPANYPIYIHCRYGSDRTGTMVALYRMAVEDWPREHAIQEMTSPHFGFHKVFTNLLRYIQQVKLKKPSLPAR